MPHSFRLLVNDLYALGYTKLREVGFHTTEGNEFYVTLGLKGPGNHTADERADLATLDSQATRAAVLLYRLAKAPHD